MTSLELTISPLHSLIAFCVKHYGDGRVEGRGDGRTPSGRDDTYSRRDY